MSGFLDLPGPLGLSLGRWLALPALLGAVYAASRLLNRVAARLIRSARGSRAAWDDRLLEQLSPAFRIPWSLATLLGLLLWLALLPDAQIVAAEALGAIAVIVFFWIAWGVVDIVVTTMAERPELAKDGSARSMLMLVRNLAKVGIFAGGAVSLLAVLGYPVTTVVAGLGIGGIALAFGAQKTLENLFGSVALALDQPFRPGDFVRVDPHLGHVEQVGLRSTRIRTLDRTVVSIPNGVLAELRIEDFAPRDRIRLETRLSLETPTRAETIDAVVQGCEQALHAHPRLWPEGAIVTVQGVSPGVITIEIIAQFDTQDFDEFRRIRHELLLSFLRLVDANGARLASPTLRGDLS